MGGYFLNFSWFKAWKILSGGLGLQESWDDAFCKFLGLGLGTYLLQISGNNQSLRAAKRTIAIHGMDTCIFSYHKRNVCVVGRTA